MKTKITSLLLGLLLLSVGVFSVASAEVKAEVGAKINGNSSAIVKVNEPGNATSTEHRSAVSAFVKSLLLVADRDGGIGPQVRIIAKEQNDAASSTAEAITKVEDRGSVRKFFFGSDYKNLGVIRSELATTDKNIARLSALANVETDVLIKAELETQIDVLKDEQVKLNAYIEDHEDGFSLFGWFVKMF